MGKQSNFDITKHYTVQDFLNPNKVSCVDGSAGREKYGLKK